jgi:hypothetical protein
MVLQDDRTKGVIRLNRAAWMCILTSGVLGGSIISLGAYKYGSDTITDESVSGAAFIAIGMWIVGIFGFLSSVLGYIGLRAIPRASMKSIDRWSVWPCIITGGGLFLIMIWFLWKVPGIMLP